MKVETTDGRVFIGSIVVGADGVHSLVRQEMWRIMDAEMPGSLATDDRNGTFEPARKKDTIANLVIDLAMESTYSCSLYVRDIQGC